MAYIPAIIRSSTDPEKVSLFIKSLAALFVLAGVDSRFVADIEGNVTNLLVALGQLITAATALWGAIRKVQFGRWSHPA